MLKHLAWDRPDIFGIDLHQITRLGDGPVTWLAPGMRAGRRSPPQLAHRGCLTEHTSCLEIDEDAANHRGTDDDPLALQHSVHSFSLPHRGYCSRTARTAPTWSGVHVRARTT